MYDTSTKAAYEGAGLNPSYGDKVVDRPPTAISGAANAMDEARSLAFRVADLVDRLCGTQPSEISGTAGKPVSSSVFSSLRDDAERTTDAVRRAMAQLNRLDRELPS